MTAASTNARLMEMAPGAHADGLADHVFQRLAASDRRSPEVRHEKDEGREQGEDVEPA